ncbi:MAG: MIP/aquaporin family protein [Actinomycetota bacterium]
MAAAHPAASAPAVSAAPPRLGEGRSYSAWIGAELAGSFLLFFGALGIGMFNPQGAFGVPFGFGFAVIAGMLAFGYISGGHFNPAITLGSALAGRTSWKSVLPYVLAQLVGMSLAAVVLWVIIGSHPAGAQSASVFASIANGFASGDELGFSMAGVFLAETIATGLLVAVYLGVTSSRERLRSAPFAVGLVFAVLTAVMLPISNAGLNPARSTAAVYFAGADAAGELWLFWVAPLLGAVIAGLLYRSAEMAPGSRRKTDDGGAPVVSAAAPVEGATAGTAAGRSDVPDVAVEDQPDEPAPADDQGAAEARDFFDRKPNRPRPDTE